MLSQVLNYAARSSKARRAVEAAPLTRRVVDRFVAGASVPQAVAAARQISNAGMSVTIDVLGEDVRDLADARSIRDGYLALLDALHNDGLACGADLSLKLSALGQTLGRSGAALATDHAREICVGAAAVGSTVTLDMEDHTTTDSTLAIGTELRKDFPATGNVLQSNLKRTDSDIGFVAATGVRIRLVKGAYREPASEAHQRKADVDIAYTRHIDLLMTSPCYPMIATHDPAMVDQAAQSADREGRGKDDWETQMLFGIRADLQRQAVQDGRRMRVYLPYGTDWYGYFMRRLAERPANVGFFLRALAHH